MMLELPSVSLVYEAHVDVGVRQDLGIGPLGQRFIVPILSGHFQGVNGLRGIVLPGGADRQLIRPDGIKQLDAVYEMQTDDGIVLSVRNQVLVDESVQPERYARSIVQVVAPAGRLGWLSQRILIGSLHSLRPERQAVLIGVYSVD
jgi:hypothetical protein